MLLGFSYAEVSGYSYRPGRLAFQWLAVMWLAVNLAGGVLPLALAARMLGAAIIIALQFLSAFRAAEYAWPQVMRSTLPAETGAKTRMLSHYLLFRKELYLVTRFKDVVPFLFCIFALELFCFYTAADSPAVIPIGAGLLIWLANEIWTVRGFANEGRGLSLYTVTLDVWRTMLSAKWLCYWALGTSIAASHYLGWQFGIERSWTNSILLFLKSTCLASTLASFGLLAGYRFTSSGRITLVGQLWHWLKQFGLQSYSSYPISSLSQGTAKRVALASTLLHEPDILLLDEPTNGLDPDQVITVRDTLQTYCAKGALILLSTHIIGLAEKIADQAAILRKGRIVCAGNPTEDVESLYVSHV